MSEQSQNIKPKNRLQHLLAKIAGNDTAKAVKPKMKNEFYLNDISENGSGGGSGGDGANVLTLYANFSEVFGEDSLDFTVYKNADLTEQYASKEEAINAIDGAGAIAVVLVESPDENMRLYPIDSISGLDYVMANVIIDAPDGLAQKPGYLYGAANDIH